MNLKKPGDQTSWDFLIIKMDYWNRNNAYFLHDRGPMRLKFNPLLIFGWAKQVSSLPINLRFLPGWMRSSSSDGQQNVTSQYELRLSASLLRRDVWIQSHGRSL